MRGESWASKNPNKLRTLVRGKTQGFFDLENIFKTTENYSNNPTNLYFKEIKTDPIGKDLSEQIDNLFLETIIPLYTPLYNNSYKVNF